MSTDEQGPDTAAMRARHSFRTSYGTEMDSLCQFCWTHDTDGNETDHDCEVIALCDALDRARTERDTTETYILELRRQLTRVAAAFSDVTAERDTALAEFEQKNGVLAMMNNTCAVFKDRALAAEAELDKVAKLYLAQIARAERAEAAVAKWHAECDAAGVPHDPAGLVRHHRGNAALIAAIDAEAAVVTARQDAWDEGYLRGQWPFAREDQKLDPIPECCSPPLSGRNANPYRGTP